jgi:hypothetical protein
MCKLAHTFAPRCISLVWHNEIILAPVIDAKPGNSHNENLLYNQSITKAKKPENRDAGYARIPVFGDPFYSIFVM